MIGYSVVIRTAVVPRYGSNILMWLHYVYISALQQQLSVFV